MRMGAKQRRTFDTDGPIAESGALGGASHDADVPSHHRVVDCHKASSIRYAATTDPTIAPP